jgi:Fe-S-cluster containining protein
MIKSDPADAADSITANMDLAGPGWRLRVGLTVPVGPTTLRFALPMVQALADAVVDGAVKLAEDRGEKISCRAGCGACCRQLVPITQVEARQVLRLVESHPEPRRSLLHARFAEARRRLLAAGLLEKLQQPAQFVAGEARPFAQAYFGLGIACPFLEDESCSIHPDRPIACREYLVTSPAANCAHPSATTVRRVPFPLEVSKALRRCERGGPDTGSWVPLVLATEWAAAHPEEPPPRPGPEWVRELVTHLTGKEVPAATEDRTGARRI